MGVDKLVKKTLEDASNAEKADYEAKIAEKMADIHLRKLDMNQKLNN